MSMNKNEFRNCIDDAVQADPYLQPRLAEKVLAQWPKRKTRVLIPVLSAVLCVAVLAFCLTRYTGLGLNSRTGRSHTDADTGTVLDSGTMTVYASNGENNKKELVLGTQTPLFYNVMVVDLRGLDDKTMDEKIEAAGDRVSEAIDRVDPDKRAWIRHSSQLFENCYVIITQLNAFDIQPDTEKTVESIRLQCSEYGQLDYCDSREGVELTDRFPKGKDLVIPGATYYEIMENASTLQIMWNPSDEMYTEISENPGISISDYGDTLIFTVNYTDGTSASSIVELTFDNDGNMSAEYLGSGTEK